MKYGKSALIDSLSGIFSGKWTRKNLRDLIDSLWRDEIWVKKLIFKFVPDAQKQADWNQTDAEEPDFIQNKPTITNGADGEDGLTPFIGANGNWWIGSTDTGIAATGPQGTAATNHALLNNLAYAESGHTGFAAINGNILQAFTALNYSLPNDFSMQSNSQYVFLWNGSALMCYFDASGNTYAAGTATASNFILSSERKLKSKIKPLTGLEWVKKIKLKKFVFKKDQTQRTRYGVIVDEIEEIAPNLVYTSETGEKMVAYIDLLLLKIAALEEETAHIKKMINESSR